MHGSTGTTGPDLTTVGLTLLNTLFNASSDSWCVLSDDDVDAGSGPGLLALELSL